MTDSLPASNGAGASEQKHRDTDIISVDIPAAHLEDGAVFYLVTVSTPVRTWTVSKRYSQFETLHNTLYDTYGAKGFPPGAALPPKRIKLLVSHISAQFIEERRILLEHYLRSVNAIAAVANSAPFLDFFQYNKHPQTVRSEDASYEFPDDAEITDISIPSTRTMSDHILYQIDVGNVRQRKSFSKWTVLKRFVQFLEMDDAVREDLGSDHDVASNLPHPPSKQMKLLVDHMDEHFVEQRRVLLQSYLNKMIRYPPAAKHKAFLHFAGVNA